MKHMLIVGFPEAFLTLIVAQETEEVDSQEINRINIPATAMLDTIGTMLDKYSDIESITFYGPEKYIEKLAKDTSIVYPEMKIFCEKAGA